MKASQCSWEKNLKLKKEKKKKKKKPRNVHFNLNERCYGHTRSIFSNPKIETK